ncbi:hypothetical protein SmJEL517_g05015 [Synchytrium microbalum]|uniref:P-type phospholipid transporter n=1 Tax=Synchytrium microbalum TaxID=1806994 RepID=A0A507C0Y4_9FUNG|nr:uncharacterized protein SmJEL517_g05015 [Synchytrium microbalum]TPX31714.1 hypothetical protein SmJEL517_g05015 [Synchytrium microbalum]
MAEIADATYNARDFQEIMEMVDKRLNDHGKNWRHVFKALTLLDYLLHSGSEAVITYAKDNIYVIRTLKEFQFIDEEGKDQGANVRQKSKDLTALLNDEARLREERAARQGMQNRIREEPTPSGNGNYDEDAQLRRALEESKRTAALDEARRREGMTDLELQRTLELLAEREQMQLEQRRIANQLTGGSTFSFENNSPTEDFDPFQPKWGGGKDVNPIGSTYNPFIFEAEAGKIRSPSMSTSNSGNNLNMVVGMNPLRPQLTGEPMRTTFPVEPLRTQHTGPSSYGVGGGGGSQFGSGFDGGVGAKPMPYQGMNDANAQMANMARNSSQIDPFANLAAGRTNPNNQFGSGGMGMGSSGMPQQNYGGAGNGSINPFGGNTGSSSSGFGGGSNYNTNTFGGSSDPNPFSATPGPGAMVLASSSGPFGSGSSAFPGQSTPFGQSNFGGQQQSSGYGVPQQQQSGFGGNTAPNPFGGANNASAFGGTSSQPFGGNNTSQPFGGASSQPFGGNTSQPFGQQSSQPFGQPQQQQAANPFGGMGSGGGGMTTQPFGGASNINSNNAFGQPQQQQQFGNPAFGSTPFGQPQQQQQQPFGNNNNFGQQPFGTQPQQQPQQPFGNNTQFQRNQLVAGSPALTTYDDEDKFEPDIDDETRYDYSQNSRIRAFANGSGSTSPTEAEIPRGFLAELEDSGQIQRTSDRGIGSFAKRASSSIPLTSVSSSRSRELLYNSDHLPSSQFSDFHTTSNNSNNSNNLFNSYLPSTSSRTFERPPTSSPGSTPPTQPSRVTSPLFRKISNMFGTDHDDDDPTRLIHLNDTIKNAQMKYLHNRVTTAKYNVLTFLPKFLYEQFSKSANLFFLFTAFIQQIGDISPTNKAGTALPLSIVVFASAVKELIEDARRTKMDQETNARLCKVLSGNTFVEKPWRDIVVGDVVRIENGQFFPADLVLLSSSEPEGLCYIETSNLDGETNLKIRQGLQETANILTPEQVARMDGMIKSEQPNRSLYTYEGTLRLGHDELPLEPLQLLLRGAMLRNTRWVYAVVVFTGHETKLMKNATSTPTKTTKVERMVNIQILYLFFILLAMSVLCALGTLIRTYNSPWEREILLLSTDGALGQFFLNILTFMILFNNLIPLSLIVTMEFVKYFLGTLINADLDMYYEVNDTPATARTSSLVEELGQIDYVFSDKTGTLTCNIMEFRMCSIGGIAYSDSVPEDKKPRIDENGQEVGYYDFKRLQDNRKNGSPQVREMLHEFLCLLSVCHTVIPETSEDEPGKIVYQASSPDEGALVKGAEMLGYIFTTRKPKTVTIVVDGREQEWEILNICEFNSTRKRMSAVVRGPDGRVKLYVKGADTVILERLSPLDNLFVERTTSHLEDYATEGLRTLCIAYRDIPEEEYQQWTSVYNKAATTINNRSAELDKAAELIENNLILLGATAIEDKLQDGVPDTIHTLMTAGIKVWVLTGDRQETAINIGYSCKLITEEMSLIICNETTHFETKDFLQKKLAAVQGGLQGTGNENPFEQESGTPLLPFWPFKKRREKLDKPEFSTEVEPLALIIDGKTLDFALERDIELIFLQLATLCKAVICCRVSPLQKALVVKLVKKNVNRAVTLAIGDGANDVGMIQAAHVGVGISGMEGLQAARSADFAIAQFRFLRKLLLVHGGWAYSRMSKLILYSFYKNITLYLIQLWFAFDNAFSGQTLFESWTLAAYNVAFALFQPVAIGIFDQYVSARMLDRYPQMYQLGQREVFYNDKAFFAWLANSFFHSLFMYYMIRGIYGEGTIEPYGLLGDNWVFGETVYTVVLITITMKAAIVTDLWVKFTYIAIFGSIALWFVLFPVWSVVGPMLPLSAELYGIIPKLYGSAAFWFILILIPFAANTRDFIWKYYKRTYIPESYHIVQEIQKYNIPDYRPRMEWFRKAVHKVRMIQRLKRSRGFAFSQNEGGQEHLIRVYDTTRRKPRG